MYEKVGLSAFIFYMDESLFNLHYLHYHGMCALRESFRKLDCVETIYLALMLEYPVDLPKASRIKQQEKIVK